MNKNSLRSSFSKSLMLWFKKEKRKLPFRKTKDPYKVWLSEIILQQTQMETGIKYYKKFIANKQRNDCSGSTLLRLFLVNFLIVIICDFECPLQAHLNCLVEIV